MKPFKTICTAVLLAMVISGCGKGNDIQKIKESFEGYKSAILNRDGAAAYSYVDSNTKAYYDDLLDKILNLSEYETKNLSLGNKIVVTMARHAIDARTLKNLDGEALFVYAVKNGWISEESVSKTEIAVSDADVDKNFAQTHAVTNNEEAPFGFSFRKEDKIWRIDLTSMMSITEMAIQQQIEKIGMDEERFIFAMLTASSGVQPDSSIWQPVN